MSFRKAEISLASPVASGGTMTVPYPAGTNAGTYAAYGHYMFARGLQATFTQDAGQMAVAFGGSNITVTYRGATPIPANTVVAVELNIQGDDAVTPRVLPDGVYDVALVRVDLGAPITADADGIAKSQAVAATEAAVLDGDTGAVLDVPRNVVGAWTGTAVVTVTGKDEYGNVVVEASGSGTSLTGKKAFKEITSIVPSASITAATFGFGDVLGLPVFLPGAGSIVKEVQDGAAAVAGTAVAGVQTLPTATTGDVRGTYDPNAAADGAKAFSLILALGDPTYRGVDQFAG